MRMKRVIHFFLRKFHNFFNQLQVHRWYSMFSVLYSTLCMLLSPIYCPCFPFFQSSRAQALSMLCKSSSIYFIAVVHLCNDDYYDLPTFLSTIYYNGIIFNCWWVLMLTSLDLMSFVLLLEWWQVRATKLT